MVSKNIIVVEYGKKFQYDNIRELIESIMGEEYYTLTEEEKHQKLKLKTYMNAGRKNIKIVDIINEEKIENIELPQYIVLDEITFLASLAKNNDLVIYENVYANNFLDGINKENLERVSKEYVRINDCANEIIERQINYYEQSNKNLKIKGRSKDEDRI